MIKIVVKSDRAKLQTFENMGFQYYELHLSSSDSLEEIPATTMQLYTVHAPHDAHTEEDLQKVIAYTKKCGGRTVVVHCDRFSLDTLKKLENKEVEILVENVPCKHDLISYVGENKFPFVIDIEHLHQSATMQNRDPNKFVEEKLEKFINAKNKIPIIHISGVDYREFDDNKPTPQQGEHLPLHFHGTIDGVEVKDLIDHDVWAKKLFPHIDAVILEIHDRRQYDIYSCVKSSKEYVEELISRYMPFNDNPRIGIMIACRMKSSRLPRKALLPIMGKPLITHLIERMKMVTKAHGIVLCTSTHPEDDPLIDIAKEQGIPWYAGHEDDVMGRFIAAAELYRFDTIIRVTGDNPLTDPGYIDRLIASHFQTGADFSKTEVLPMGVNAEVIPLSTLKKAHKLCDDPNLSEYMTAYLKQPKYFKINIMDVDPVDAQQGLRLTVDYQEDLDLMNEIYSRLYDNGKIFPITETIQLLTDKEPHLADINKNIEERPLPKVSMEGEFDPTLQNVVIVGADINGLSGEIIQKIREKKLFNIVGFLDDEDKNQYLQFEGIPVATRITGITKEKLPQNASAAIIGLSNESAFRNAEHELRKADIEIIPLERIL